MPLTTNLDTLAVKQHTHEYTVDASTADTGTPGSIAPDDTAAEGTADSLARSDHTHGVTAGAASDLTRTDTSSEGDDTSFARSDHVHATDALGWGLLLPRFLSTVDSSAYTTSTTDMTVTVDVTAGRMYRIAVHSYYEVAGSTTPALFQFNCHAGTTKIGTFDHVPILNSNDFQHVLDATVSFPSAGTGAITFDLRIVQVTGSPDTVTFVAANNNPRTFEVYDVGPSA